MRQNANVQESKSKLYPKNSWSSREKLMKAPHMGTIPSTSILRLKFELTKKTLVQNYQHTYGGWKKSCTTWDGWNPMNNGINHRSTGAGFLPSTVSTSHGFGMVFGLHPRHRFELLGHGSRHGTSLSGWNWRLFSGFSHDVGFSIHLICLGSLTSIIIYIATDWNLECRHVC